MDKSLAKDFIVSKLRKLRESKVKSHKKDFDVANALIGLKSEMPGAPRIVLLAGFNEAARPELIKYQSEIYPFSNHFIQRKSCSTSGWFPRRNHQYQHQISHF